MRRSKEDGEWKMGERKKETGGKGDKGDKGDNSE
jgi:hypothetical protein